MSRQCVPSPPRGAERAGVRWGALRTGLPSFILSYPSARPTRGARNCPSVMPATARIHDFGRPSPIGHFLPTEVKQSTSIDTPPRFPGDAAARRAVNSQVSE